MSKPLNCFILAAGLGERLRPVTDHIPKPLLPVLGRPVLQSVLGKVSALPVGKIGVNLHYKKEAIAEWLERSCYREKVALFPEDPILDTGGALKNAGELLSAGAFLVHNSDIVSDVDLAGLVEAHFVSGNLATLAVHDFPRFNHVAVDREGSLRGVGNNYRISGNERWVAFTGIAVYSPEFLELLPRGRSSVVTAWLEAVNSGRRIGTLDVSGCFWSDIGTPAAYAKTVLDTLRSEGETVYVHPDAQGCCRAWAGGLLVAESGSAIAGDASLRNCILLPGSRVAPPIPSASGGAKEGNGGVYENCIIGPGFVIQLSEADTGVPAQDGAVLVGTGGSDRKYFRVKHGRGTAILMQCAQDDRDYHRHMEYTEFFRKHGIPVPEVMGAEPGCKRATFEDLGDISLYSWLKCARSKDRIEGMYRKVLDAAVLLHTTATAHAPECPLLAERVFDYAHLRWETGYFAERFVKDLAKAEIRNPSALDDELHRLAARVDSFPKTIVHRDFQSQNIMIGEGGSPKLIDYQGARIGPPAYDIASMLWDPYYRIEDAARERLVRYYLEKMSSAGGCFSGPDFPDALIHCRLQRHMQALGAYGFLSMVKGKKYFLKHVPEAVRLLKEETSLVRGDYPELYALVRGL